MDFNVLLEMKRALKLIYVMSCLLLATGVGALAWSLINPPELEVRDGSGIGNMTGDTFWGGSIYGFEADRVRRIAIPRKVGVEPLYYYFRVPMTDPEFNKFMSMSGKFQAFSISSPESVPELSKAPDWLPYDSRGRPVAHVSGPGGPSSHIYRDESGYTIFRTD